MSAIRTAPLDATATPVSSPELRAETVSTYEGFLDLRPAWDRLVESAQVGHPFLEHDWIRTWWDCFGAGSQMRIVVVKSGDRPVAIAPLILTSVKIWGIPVRRLGFFYNDHVPRADFIVHEPIEEAYRCIWNHLLQTRDWDLLQLCQLTEDSETLAPIVDFAVHDGCAFGLWPSSISPFVSLNTTWSAYLNGLEAKFRSNLRNRFKRLDAIHPIEVLTSADPDAELLQTAFEIESAGWKGEAGTAISCNHSLRQFYNLLAERAAERGWLRLNFLKSNGASLAFGYSLQYKNRLFLLKSGYDPAHAAYSPTNLLVCRVLERAFQHGIELYDFLGDNAEWKSRWTSDVRHHYWLFVFRRSWKGRLLHSIKFRLIPLLKSILRSEAQK